MSETNLGSYKVIVSASYEGLIAQTNAVMQTVQQSAERITATMDTMANNVNSKMASITASMSAVAEQSGTLSRIGNAIGSAAGGFNSFNQGAEEAKKKLSAIKTVEQELENQISRVNRAQQLANDPTAINKLAERRNITPDRAQEIYNSAVEKCGQKLQEISQRIIENEINIGKTYSKNISLLEQTIRLMDTLGIKSSELARFTQGIRVDKREADRQTSIPPADKTADYLAKQNAQASKQYWKDEEAAMNKRTAQLQEWMQLDAKQKAKELAEINQIQTAYDRLYRNVAAHIESNTKLSALSFTKMKTDMAELEAKMSARGIMPTQANPLAGYANYGQYAKQFSDMDESLKRAAASGNVITNVLGKMRSHLEWMAGAVALGALLAIPFQGVAVITQVEQQMAGMKQVLPQLQHNQELLNQTSMEFIGIASHYGMKIDEITESAKLWGRAYKDIGEVEALMHSSATLAVADSFSMVEANKALESTMMQYQMRAYSVAEAQQYSMRIADSWTQVAHNAIVSAQDLAAANERSASAAYQAGVSFDFLQGIIATMSRNTGRAGGELGNSIRAMMVSIHSDKAVKEIEKLGVSMFEVGQNGKKSFRDTEQVLMDLMITADATDKSVEKMLLGISGGKFQYNKISALIGDYSELIRTVELSINSQGAATHQAEMQLDTISRKFQKLKDELAGVAVGAGNGGLTQFLKDILDGLNVIVARIQTIPAGNWKLIGWAIELSVALLAGQAAMKLGTAAMGAYNSVIAAGVASSAAKTAANVTEAASQQMVNIVGADGAVISRVVAGAKAAETVETVKLTMAERARAVATGLATGGLSLLTGFLITGAVGLAMMNTQSEEAAKKTLEHASAEEKLIAQLKDKEATLNGEANLMQSKIKFSEDLASVYPKLLAQLKAEEEAGKDTTKTKERLTVTEHALASMLGEDALARIKASSDTKAAIQKEIDAVKDKRNGVLQAAQETKQEEIEHTKVAIEESQKRLAAVKAEAEGKADAAQKQLAVGDSSKLLKLKAEVELGDPTNDINKNRYGSQVIDTTVWKQSHDKALAEYRNALQAEADTENQKLQKLQENFKKHFSERSAAYVDESALKSAKSEYEYGEKQLALDKILHKNQVEVAKQRFEYAKAYFNQLAEIESRYKDMAEKNGQEYKPSKEFIDAKIKYVEAIHAIIEAEKAELKESNEIAEQKLAYDKVIGADEVVMAQKRLDNMNNYFTKMAQYEAQYKYAILSGGGEYKETKDYSDAKIKRAQAQAALYKAEIDKANALGQLAYNTEKLLKEAEIVEKTGGDSTVKRYQALKEAVKEYLSELEKVQKTKIDLWSSNSKLSIVMDNSSLGDMKEVGKVWIDNKEKVVQSATAIRLNLQSIENEMILEGNNEKYLNALGLKDHLESIQTKLNSDKLGSQQRIELIKQEVQAFAQYENTIREGMIDAERQIEAFQKKLLANTQQATELLKRAGAPDTKIEEMWERIYEAREKAFLAKDDKSTQDYTDFLKFQDEAAKYVPKYKMKFDISKEDYNKIAEAAINENSRMQNIIDRLQDNIASLGNLAQKAQEIGAKSVTAFLNEWANGLNNLGNMLQNALGGVEIPQIPNAEGIIAYAQKQNAPQIPQQSRDDIKGYVSGGGRTVNVGGIVVNMPIENVNKEVDVDKYKSAVVNEIMTTMKQYVDNDDAAYAT